MYRVFNCGYFRGQIYYAELPVSIGSVQCGKRPVVIVSNNTCNTRSPICTVVPVTTAEKRVLPTHFDIDCGKVKGTVLCEQLLTIDQKQILSYAGTLTRNSMEELNKALAVQLGLSGSSSEDSALEAQVKEAKELSEQCRQVLDRLNDMIKTCEQSSAPTPKPVLEQVETPEKPVKRKYRIRNEQETRDFLHHWRNAWNNVQIKKTLAEQYGFSSVTTANTFYNRHKFDFAV